MYLLSSANFKKDPPWYIFFSQSMLLPLVCYLSLAASIALYMSVGLCSTTSWIIISVFYYDPQSQCVVFHCHHFDIPLVHAYFYSGTLIHLRTLRPNDFLYFCVERTCLCGGVQHLKSLEFHLMIYIIIIYLFSNVSVFLKNDIMVQWKKWCLWLSNARPDYSPHWTTSHRWSIPGHFKKLL